MATIQISDLNISERNKAIYILTTGIQYIEFTSPQSKAIVISNSIEMLLNGNNINYNLHKQYKWLVKLSLSINYGTRLITCYIGVQEFINIIKYFGEEVIIDRQNHILKTATNEH